jgi:hypothetical protein
MVPAAPKEKKESEALIPLGRWKDPGSWTWNLNLSLGKKFLEPAWDPVNEQTELRAALDFRQQRWPVNVAVDFLVSGSEKAQVASTGRTYQGSSAELSLGVRKIWDRRFLSMRPYNGVGLTYAAAALDASDFDNPWRRSSWGLWGQGGVYWELEKHLNLGLEISYSFARVLLFQDKVNAGGFHTGLLAGFHY